MNIGNNVQGQHSLHKVNKEAASQQEKLSTAKTINTAEDNAVSYIAGKKLETTIAGQEKALEAATSASEEDRLSASLKANSSANGAISDTEVAIEQADSIRQQIMLDTASAPMVHSKLSAAAVLKFM